jgi:hypothetical protein
MELYFCSMYLLSGRGQEKLCLFSLPFPRGITSAVSEARHHIRVLSELAHCSVRQLIFHTSSLKTGTGLCAPHTGIQCCESEIIIYFLITFSNTESTACSAITNTSPDCSTDRHVLYSRGLLLAYRQSSCCDGCAVQYIMLLNRQ